METEVLATMKSRNKGFSRKRDYVFTTLSELVHYMQPVMKADHYHMLDIVRDYRKKAIVDFQQREGCVSRETFMQLNDKIFHMMLRDRKVDPDKVRASEKYSQIISNLKKHEPELARFLECNSLNSCLYLG